MPVQLTAAFLKTSRCKKEMHPESIKELGSINAPVC